MKAADKVKKIAQLRRQYNRAVGKKRKAETSISTLTAQLGKLLASMSYEDVALYSDKLNKHIW